MDVHSRTNLTLELLRTVEMSVRVRTEESHCFIESTHSITLRPCLTIKPLCTLPLKQNDLFRLCLVIVWLSFGLQLTDSVPGNTFLPFTSGSEMQTATQTRFKLDPPTPLQLPCSSETDLDLQFVGIQSPRKRVLWIRYLHITDLLLPFPFRHTLLDILQSSRQSVYANVGRNNHVMALVATGCLDCLM